MPQASVNPAEVFVIVPCYNEAEVIKQVLSGLIAENYTLVVIDDGSTDNSRKILQDLPVHFLAHMVNLGQGAALETGMQYARDQGAKYVVHFDADGQHHPDVIPRLLQPLIEDEADIVLGSRFLEKEHTEAIPKMRRWVLRVAILVNKLFSGLWLSDAHNGLRAMNATGLAAIRLSENRMAHATEVLILMKQEKLRYKEVPVLVAYHDYAREKGQSSLNSINILIDLIFNRIL